MRLDALAAAPRQITPSLVAGQLSELSDELVRLDSQLEAGEAQGGYPAEGFREWIRDLADGLDHARAGVARLLPANQDLVLRMGQEMLNLGEGAGQTKVMTEQQLPFTGGWGELVDGSIQVVQEAEAAVRSLPEGPGTPPASPVPGRPGASGQVIEDASRAAQLVRQSLATIAELPADDRGSAATKDARLAAHGLNMDAQRLIEPHFQSADTYVTSALRTADASLEDANWQLARKPSPDGRFTGVDVPGAQRSTAAAASTLEDLVAALSTGA